MSIDTRIAIARFFGQLFGSMPARVEASLPFFAGSPEKPQG